MHMNRLEEVQLRGTTQWVRICGSDASNPVLLLMQLGPGLPIINEVSRFQRLLALEDAFTVVYWDQPGTGLSLRRDSNREDLTAARVVADTVSLLELLCERFDRKLFIAGFSFGATFAARAVVERPDLAEVLVAVGMDIDVPAAEANAYEFALDTARQRHHRRAIRQLENIGSPPHVEGKQFRTRARWTANFGGLSTNANYNSAARALLVSLLRSPDYSIADVIRTIRGVNATQAALLPQLADTNLVRTMPRLEVPIVMVQGRIDQVTPARAAQRFDESLVAPSKQLVWFDSSAHTPHLEEPERFRDVLMSVRASQVPTH